jgi:hypothetical protein
MHKWDREDGTVDIGSRLELFVDRLLVDSLTGTAFKMHAPHPAAPAAHPVVGAYMTVLRDGPRYRAYYREYDPAYTGKQYDGNEGEMTCTAESPDGRAWSFPELGVCEVNGSSRNNVVLARRPPFCHNFAPFLDANPAAPPEARYKALAGTHPTEPNRRESERFVEGLYAFRSADGLHWEPMHDKAAIIDPDFAFDSQNVSFWSVAEGRYVCYYRSWRTSHGELRSISRTTSPDYLHWDAPVDMNPNLPGEHLYTSQTHPYFRAPHIYIALPTRYQPDRGSSTDILFMATRAGSDRFERLFTEAFIRPGLDPARWGDRSNYAACGVVPTGPAEMSIYHAHSGQRYVLRTDGFISINAGAGQGEFITKPLTFAGQALVLNTSTSAAGSVQVEVQSARGEPIPGYALNDCLPLIADSIECPVVWKNGPDVGSLAGRPVRLRFVMKEADLFALQFRART